MSGRYNKNEDIELLRMFAMIADINNEKVTAETSGDKMFDDIRRDVSEFTQSREVQNMIIAEDLAIMEMNSQNRWERKEGRKEGRKDIIELNRWLIECGRGDDVLKAAVDTEYMDKLMKEYNEKVPSKADELQDR